MGIRNSVEEELGDSACMHGVLNCVLYSHSYDYWRGTLQKKKSTTARAYTCIIGGGIGGAGGASAPPLFSEKPVNIINTYTCILGAEHFSPPTFCLLPPPLCM